MTPPVKALLFAVLNHAGWPIVASVRSRFSAEREIWRKRKWPVYARQFTLRGHFFNAELLEFKAPIPKRMRFGTNSEMYPAFAKFQ